MSNPEGTSEASQPTVNMDIPRRGTASSESVLLERTRRAVADCREELSSLRGSVKAAQSYREKSAMIYTCASNAVLELEALFDATISTAGGGAASMAQERAVTALATRLCAGIGRAEAWVQTQGSMSAMGKMFGKLKGSGDATDKYDTIANELRNLEVSAKENTVIILQQQQQQQQQQYGRPQSAGGGTSVSGSEVGIQSIMSQQIPSAGSLQLHATMSGLSSGGALSTAPSNLSAGAAAAAAATAAGGGASPAPPPTHPSVLPAILEPSVNEQQLSDQQTQNQEFSPRSPPTSTLATTTTGAARPRHLRRSTRSETITALAYVPPSTTDPSAGSLGKIWYYVGRVFGADRFTVLELSSGVSAEVPGGRNEGTVSAIHVDYRGYIWTGHKSGAVTVWDEAQRSPVCPTIRVTSGGVSAIAVDENGAAWVGSDRGDIRRVMLTAITAEGGAMLERQLRIEGGLRHSGGNHSERAATAKLDEFGMVVNPKAREKAHEGKVTALAAAAGRVWTSGGATAFVCFREWSQRGELMAKHDLQAIGNAEAMIIVTPIVRVSRPLDSATSLASTLSTSPTSQPSSFTSGASAATAELPQAWQLLTGHSRGLVQVWGDVGGALRPLMRIDLGERASPVTGMSICEPLGAICTSHLDGKVLVLAVPDPRGPGALPAMLAEKSIASAALPRGEIPAADIGVAKMDGSPVGAITAAFDAGMSFWPESHLRSAADEAGALIQPPDTPQDQWRLFKLNPITAHQAMLALAASRNNGDLLASRRPSASGQQQNNTNRQSEIFSAGAQHWLIDYEDVELDKKIGEGAFGTVYVGRWQQIDVAVKVLSSLEALGISNSDAAAALTADGFDESDLPTNVGEALRTLQREVRLMTTMRHPNIILFLGVCMRPPCVVTEFCDKGSLYDLLREARENSRLAEQLTWPRRLRIAMEAAKGMLYLHSHKPAIIHRDLKSPNLLIDRDFHAKVTDFGLSRLSEAAAVASSVVASNPRWQAPEVIVSGDFTYAGDVYAFGLILWELATWDLPFEGLSQFQIIVAVGHQGVRPPIPGEFDSGDGAHIAGAGAGVDAPVLRGGVFPGWERYAKLMKECWAQDPAQRPDFGKVCDELKEVLADVAAAGGAEAKAAQVVEEETAAASLAVAQAAETVAVGEQAAVEQEAPAAHTPAAATDEALPPHVAAPEVSVVMKSPFDAPTVEPRAIASPFDAPSTATSAPDVVAAVPPPSPFDAPAATTTTATAVPAPGPPPSPFDAPAAQQQPPPQPMASPFDAPSAPAAPAAVVAVGGPPRSPFDAPVATTHVASADVTVGAVEQPPATVAAASTDGGGSPQTAATASSSTIGNSSQGGSSAGSFLRKFRESLQRKKEGEEVAGVVASVVEEEEEAVAGGGGGGGNA